MAESVEHLRAILNESEVVFSRDQIESAVERMAERIAGQLADTNPLVLTVMLGGQMPASAILTRLNFPLEMDYLHATRYGMETTGGELTWIARPRIPMKDRTVLIIDDILDEGHTLAQIVEHCRKAGAKNVFTAVLINKIHDRRVEGINADFVGLRVDDRYIFGYGMDYKGYFRNLPAIYALKDGH